MRRVSGLARLSLSNYPTMLLAVPAVSALATAAPAWLTAYQQHELALGRGLAVLGGWALLNMLVSGYQLPRADARRWPHHFHLMNCGWAVVNAVLAAVGILRTHPGVPPPGFSAAAALADQTLTGYIFAGNALLDVGYVLLGAWLLARAAAPAARRPERSFGYGRSIQLQGAFLLVFDVGMYVWLR